VNDRTIYLRSMASPNMFSSNKNWPKSRPVVRLALFDYGFRPFFLLAGAYALAIVPIWLFFYADQLAPFGVLPPMYWHAWRGRSHFWCT
jgi:hypothetical protein